MSCGLVEKVQRNRERQIDDGRASGLSGGALAGFIRQEEVGDAFTAAATTVIWR
jgi:hypothetical protein